MSHNMSQFLVIVLLILSTAFLAMPFILVIGFLRQFRKKEGKEARHRLKITARVCGLHAVERAKMGQKSVALLVHQKFCDDCGKSS